MQSQPRFIDLHMHLQAWYASTKNTAYMRLNTRDQLSHRDAIGAKVHGMEWHMTATEKDIGRYETVSNSGKPPWEIRKNNEIKK